MAKNILPENSCGLNFTHRQYTYLYPIVSVGSQMARLLRCKEIKTLQIEEKACKLIQEWNRAIIRLALAHFSNDKFKE